MGTAAVPVANTNVSSNGVAVNYRLPLTGPLPRTYRVTLAIVDARKPGWTCAAERT